MGSTLPARTSRMSSLSDVLFVTGIAAHSLGETFLNLYLANEPASKVIGADLFPPSNSLHRTQVSTFPFDLNPLTSASGYGNFAGDLGIALEKALDQVAG